MKLFKLSLIASALGASIGVHAAEVVIESFEYPDMVGEEYYSNFGGHPNEISDSWSSDGTHSLQVDMSTGGNLQIEPEFDWSSQEVFKFGASNPTSQDIEFKVKFVATSDSGNKALERVFTLGAGESNDAFAVDLTDDALPADFIKANIFRIFFYPSVKEVEGTMIYIDHLRADDEVDGDGDGDGDNGPSENPKLINDFSGYGHTDSVWPEGQGNQNAASESVQANPLDADLNSWLIEFEDGKVFSEYWVNDAQDSNWDAYDTVEITVINTSGLPMTLLARLQSGNTGPDFYSPADMAITAVATPQVFALDLDSESNRGDNFTKEFVESIRFALRGYSPNIAPLYIDKIELKSGDVDDEEQTTIESFDYHDGYVMGGNHSVKSQQVTDEYDSATHGLSWKLEYNILNQYAEITPSENNWADWKTLEMDVLNPSDAPVNASIWVLTQNKWSDEYYLQYPVTVKPSEEDQFETIMVNLEADIKGEEFNKDLVHRVQFRLAGSGGESVDTTLYYDNIVVSNRDVDTGEPGEPGEEQVVEDFESRLGTTPVYHVANEVVHMEEEGFNALMVNFTQKTRNSGIFFPYATNDIIPVRNAKVFKVDVLNESKNAEWVKFEIGSSNCAQNQCYSVASKLIPADGQWHTIEFSIADGALSDFDQALASKYRVGTPNAYSGNQTKIYLNNLRVADALEGEGDQGDKVINTIPEYKNEGGSFGLFSLLLMPLMVLLRRRK
ncbi:GlyGly-CTERM sorting domain-containing protein [Vibrio sp. WXL103]|uniref:GlyGly-CTERM sorting domain-containing protein n=1 Tax=Vibrio sp. WXL103 TaxID=3450710 RepID=UPI003EC649C0